MTFPVVIPAFAGMTTGNKWIFESACRNVANATCWFVPDSSALS
jgi:hypothetical protein